jgi:hypothetical protein
VTAQAQWTRHVEDLFPTLGELFSAGEEVAALAGHPGWRHVVAMLDHERGAIDRTLDTAGMPLSRAQYAMWHGRRGGLAGAQGAVEAILDKYALRLEEQKDKHESAAGSAREG